MNTHEYQAKVLLKKFGVPVPPFFLATNEEEIAEGMKEFNWQQGVVKAQIHAGGRGKAGGVKIAHTAEQLQRTAEEMLGMRFITAQTGSQGIICNKVLITPLVDIKKEYYLAAIMDRSSAQPMLLASSEGGMDIEEIAKTKPESLIKIPIQLDGSVRSYHILELVKFLGWEGDIRHLGGQLITQVAQAFITSDASLLEINPLVLTAQQELVALDAKLSVDDNALYRQPGMEQWYDPDQQTPGERIARQQGLAYIGLDGTIGCLVNGAGLAMATMDIIQYYGGKPANFLDVGGGATQEQVAYALKIILSDSRVRVIFVNIFGGIMDCGILAHGLVDTLKVQSVNIPLIVRLEGTNVEIGKKCLADSGFKITSVNSMEEGAKEAIKWQS
ncbi:MAG: ADP-forming succinate--CoA ligase subunit beta [Verrucomicrobia bacterium]|nr:ADP-forming succinate--CoA ligase subunit beta [Verrucomicrobiota bacterium]MBS0646044.1 ADP-forming succinate--CoA ligase subunit beta [Verrucomicrobiota bacterium]